MKICNGLILILALTTITFIETKPTKKRQIYNQPQGPQGPIGNPNSNQNRSVVITCPVCPNYICTAPTGITGISGCTGLGCTGPCLPNLVSSFCCLDITESATVRGFVTTNLETVSGNLSVSGNANFQGDTIVEGNVFAQGNQCVGQNLSVNQNLSVDGFSVVLGNLTIDGPVSINGNFTQNGNSVFQGNLTTTGNSTVGGNITVGCQALFNGPFTANSATMPALSVFNGAVINNGLTIANSGCLSTGFTGCTGAIINGNLCIVGDLTVTKEINVLEEFTLDSNATFNGQVTTTGTLITNSNVIVNDSLDIAIGDQEITAGNLNLLASTGLLQIGGQTTLESSVTFNQGAIFLKGATLEGGKKVPTGDFNIPQGSANVEGILTANGTITSNAGQSQFGSVVINDPENALCYTGPAALTVAGGVGIAKNLWLGGCQYFENVELQGGIPSCLDYYEEASFSTAFIWGGLTVNPPNNVTIRIVRVGNVVNLYIPEIIYNNPGVHIDVVTSTNPIPPRFRPTSTVRGASSTIIYNDISGSPLHAELGEYDISPAGIITFGLPGTTPGVERIVSDGLVYVDINTITYNITSEIRNCKTCNGN